ncbi:hypothetical protein POTOM_042528 [Populus tomentosa]|uniref:Chalcone synthase n=1 Tax=Populus tomentosa TaxID=118781 RepID=A0A8X8CH58_POPTO|nr:hypothetical protein POTOM_042528 [Populus tomentosa]
MALVDEIRKAQRARGPAMVLTIGTAVPVNCFYQADYPDYFFRDIVLAEVPKLGKETALKPIQEWGHPMSKITHLVFCTTSSVHMPGADYQLANLLGLSSSVKRLMLYQQGCYGGGTALRAAKDLAENNAGAAIIGSDLDTLVEKPIFQLVSAAQIMIPDSEHAIEGHVREMGLLIHLSEDVPKLISDNVEAALREVVAPIGGVLSDWNPTKMVRRVLAFLS